MYCKYMYMHMLVYTGNSLFKNLCTQKISKNVYQLVPCSQNCRRYIFQMQLQWKYKNNISEWLSKHALLVMIHKLCRGSQMYRGIVSGLTEFVWYVYYERVCVCQILQRCTGVWEICRHKHCVIFLSNLSTHVEYSKLADPLQICSNAFLYNYSHTPQCFLRSIFVTAIYAFVVFHFHWS